MNSEVNIRAFVREDAKQVRALFIATNRLLAPPHLRDAFEAYIAQSLVEEIDRIADYYAERDGGFWVAIGGNRLAGMFGLERIDDGAMELRRMYVDPAARRRGIARKMLQFAEDECASPSHIAATWNQQTDLSGPDRRRCLARARRCRLGVRWLRAIGVYLAQR